MRIISKFKDYYDGCQGYTDSEGIYKRETIDNPMDWNLFRSVDFYQCRFVGFCGKLYPFFTYVKELHDREFNPFNPSQNRVTVFNYGEEIDYEQVFAELPKYWGGSLYYSNSQRQSMLNEIKGDAKRVKSFNDRNNGKNFDSLFIELGTPVFYCDWSDCYRVDRSLDSNMTSVQLDPCLKDFGFQKVFDPFGCYQELGMYLRNQLADTTSLPVPVGDDKVLAESKGFDRFSFRKDKSK